MQGKKYQDYKNELKSLNSFKEYDLLEKFKEINQRTPLPSKLYRYRPLNEFTFNEILNQHIYLSKFSDFDDIYDGKLLINENREMEGSKGAYYIARACQDYSPEMKKNYEGYEKFFCQREELLDKNYKIACFTEDNRNIPMWYYYADKHKGICIEYDTKEPEINAEKEKNIFLPAVYARDLNPYYVDRYSTEHEWEVMLLLNGLLKHNDWSFEREWRLIVKITEDEWNRNPYCNMKMKAIYFGMNMSEDMKKVIKVCIQNMGLQIDLYQMKQDITGLVKERYI